MTRVGFLGGSFDPIHLGHLWIAIFARERIPLDRVLIAPAAVPPHKLGGARAPIEFRMRVAAAAVAGHSGLEVTDLDAEPSRPSFTIDSLRRLRSRLAPDDEIWLLLGADTLADLPNWREPDAILDIASLAVYGRAGFEIAAPLERARIRRIDGPACGLSSTLIRDRIRDGLPVSGLVPGPIAPLLEGRSPYRAGDSHG